MAIQNQTAYLPTSPPTATRLFTLPPFDDDYEIVVAGP
jgi:hypothetical protein